MMPLKIFRHGEVNKGATMRPLFRDTDREPPGESGRTIIKGGNRVAVISQVLVPVLVLLIVILLLLLVTMYSDTTRPTTAQDRRVQSGAGRVA